MTTVPRQVPDAIFFDVDGVLIDSMGVKGEAFAAAFDDRADLHDEIIAFHHARGGVTRSQKIAGIFELAFGRAPTSQELDARVAAFSDAVLQQVIVAPEIPGATRAVRRWADRAPLHAVSATPAAELVHVFAERGMTPSFTSVTGWPPHKSEIVASIIAQHGYRPGHCVLIGDSREDLASARACGVHFVQVSGSAASDLPESTVTVRDLTTLDDAVEQALRLGGE